MEVECQSLFHWQESLAAVLLFTLNGLEMPRVDWAQRKQCSALNWQWELNPSASKRAAVGHGHRGSGSISLILCLQRLPCKKEEKTDERKRLSWANATLCGDLKMSREGLHKTAIVCHWSNSLEADSTRSVGLLQDTVWGSQRFCNFLWKLRQWLPPNEAL